jgi:hypothetical protein
MAGRDLLKHDAKVDAKALQKGKGADVFDKLGNEGVLEKVEAAKKEQGPADKETSLLDLAAAEKDQPEAAAKDPAKEAKDPVVAAEPAKEAPEEVVEEVVAQEEAKKDEPAVLAAAAPAVVEEGPAKKPPTIDEAAKKLEQEKLAAQEADKKKEEPLKEAASQKKAAGLAAREKVTALIQQLTSNPIELQVLATATDPAQKATQIVEYVAQYLGERDLQALAASGHEDLTGLMVVGADARQQMQVLSPQALRMGAFAPILAQLVLDELDRQPATAAAGQSAEEGGVEQAATEIDPRRVAPVLNRISTKLRHAAHA